MFNKPVRNHITIIPEQIGAAGFILMTFVVTALYEIVSSGYNIFSKSFWLRMADSFSGGQGQLMLIAALGIAAVMVLVLVWLFARWLKTVFYIDGEYLVSQRNTLVKKQARLPVSSISTVNLERNVFERIVGTAKIKLDLNSAATANKTDFTFVLSLEKALAFEKELLRIKEESNVKVRGEEQETQAVKERTLVYSFSAFQVLRHALLNCPLGQFAAVALLFVIGLELDREYLYGQVQREIISLGGLTALGWAANAVAQFVSAWNFRVERDENGIYISSGLLKKKSYSFETEKINALIVRRPLLGRISGLCSAEVAVVGLGNDKKETPQVSLLLKQEELEKIVAVCAPGFECKGERVREAGAGIIPSFAGHILLGLCVAAALSHLWSGFFAVCPVVSVLLAYLSHSARTVCSDETAFSYSNGFFSRKICFFKIDDIQTFQLRTDILMKRLGVGRIRLSILSSNAMSVHTTGWFGTRVFDVLEQKIKG